MTLWTGGFPSQRPVTGSFDVFFDLCLNKWLSKQSRRHWFETPSHSLSHHCNGSDYKLNKYWLSAYMMTMTHLHTDDTSGGHFKNTYELLNLRTRTISMYKNHIFQCMGKIFCVEFQTVPLKFRTKYLIHTLKDVDFIHGWKFKSSYI